MTSSPPTIFVQIASYRDPECQWTVKDLFEKADHPDQVTVGICWQADMEADKDCFLVPSPRPGQTRVVTFHPQEANGVCWARAETQKLFGDQDYVLMIDSHMRFIPGWDTALVEELALCPSPKPFLSTYPPGYKPPNQLEQNPRPIVMRAKPFNEQGDIRFDGETLYGIPEKPLRGAFLAAGLLFAPGRFVREVPYDPYLYFDHEEITLASRAFTHGWDVYSPVRPIIYHYYNEPGKGETRALHWVDRKDWGKFAIVSRQRYNYLLCGTEPKDKEALKDIERYGLGTVRSLAEYESFSGINFKKKIASDRARKSEFIDDLDLYRTQQKKPSPVSKKTGLPYLTPLETGDFMPPFCMRDDSGKWREIQLFAGKPCIVCLLPSAFDDFVREFMTLFRERFHQADVRLIFIAPVAATEAAVYRQRNNIPQGVMADENRALSHAFGNFDRAHDTPVTCALDSNQRIVSISKNRNARDHMADVLRMAEQLSEQAKKNFMTLPAAAPVLIVPDVLTAESRAKIISYWERGAKYAGTIGAGGDEKVVTEGKRRIDVDVTDAGFLEYLDVTLCKRLFPEIRKVFALDVTCRDRYKIGLYTGEDKGFYNLHRDTGVPALAHRRVSVSFLLNDDFEGGMLVMPEYGPQAAFRAPAGSAICFPSSVMHAVTPVTSGRRFIMVSFFHGDAEEEWRRKYHELVKAKYVPQDVRIFCTNMHQGITYSDSFYTRGGNQAS